jgi:hypothetical protein
MQCPPLLVVTSRLADDRLWWEALNLGGYNVLAKPLNMKKEMTRAHPAAYGFNENTVPQPLNEHAELFPPMVVVP